MIKKEKGKKKRGKLQIKEKLRVMMWWRRSKKNTGIV